MGDGLIMVITLPMTLTKSAKKILVMMVLLITVIYILLTTLTKTAKAFLAVMVTIGTTGN